MNKRDARKLMYRIQSYEFWISRFEKEASLLGDPDLNDYIHLYLPDAELKTKNQVWEAFDCIEEILLAQLIEGKLHD